MYMVYRHKAITHFSRLQHSVNITFTCTRKPKSSIDSLCCGGLELNLQYLRYACVFFLAGEADFPEVKSDHMYSADFFPYIMQLILCQYLNISFCFLAV